MNVRAHVPSAVLGHLGHRIVAQLVWWTRSHKDLLWQFLRLHCTYERLLPKWLSTQVWTALGSFGGDPKPKLPELSQADPKHCLKNVLMAASQK